MIDGKDENGNDKSFRPLSGSYISQLFRSKQLTLFQKKVSVPYRGATFLNCGSSVYTDIEFQDCFRPLSGSYISQCNTTVTCKLANKTCFRPLSGSYISQYSTKTLSEERKWFPSPIGELHFSIIITPLKARSLQRFRPLSGSYISQYHPRNPMSCLGRIGGLRGKSNFIEIQLFWKVKSSHKSSI